MTALALHLPEERALSRWTLAGLTILLAHLAIIAAIALWHARRQAEPAILPAIAVSLVPVDASSPEVLDQDLPVGPAMQQAEEARKQQLEEEKPVEKPEPPPVQQPQAEVTLPKVQEKDVEPPKPILQPPAPETRAPQKTQHIGQFSEAAARAYNALVFGHMQRFKRYPASGRGAHGTVVVRFELDRKGDVIASAVTKSSGSAVLDQEALALFKRASPFPPFPSTKPGDRDSFMAPVNFAP
jgi:periplasmic protein TonB